MRFKRYQKPELGQTRIVYKFAWLPTIVGEYVVWLETYAVHQQYEKNIYYFGGKLEYRWEEIRRNICDFY